MKRFWNFTIATGVLALFLMPSTLMAQANLTSKASQPPAQPSPYNNRVQLLRNANAHYEKKEYASAAGLFTYAIALGDKTSGTAYDAACCLALSSDKEAAFRYLQLALSHGWRDSSHLSTDIDLTSLHMDPRWQKIIERCQKAEATYRRKQSNPDNVELVTSDIPHFWDAYEKAKKVPLAERAAILEREYVDKESIGLQDFLRVRNVDLTELVTYIEQHPHFYATIQSATLSVATQKEGIRACFHKLKELYPPAQFPNVYFCIGGFHGGGTVSDNGLLLSAEMFSQTAETPIDELNGWEVNVLSKTTDIAPVTAHELIHFQQKYPAVKRTVLSGCIQEGSADFVGELISGRMPDRSEQLIYSYGNAHERELWEQFQKEMDSGEVDHWLYSVSKTDTHPEDLGYYMGYKICESYYKQAKDKKQAIYDILNIKDFSAFFKASKYAEKFP